MNESYLDRIETYLSGEMSQDERLQFESELKTNEELATLFRVNNSIDMEMGSLEKHKQAEASLRKKLDEIGAGYFKTTNDVVPAQKTEIRIFNLGRLAVAAAIVGIIALGVIWYIKNENKSENVIVNVKKPDSSNNAQKKNIDTSGIANTELPEVKPEKIKSIELPNEGRYKALVPHDPDNIIDTLSVAKWNALFADNFKPDEAPTDIAKSLQPAIDQYKNEDYEAAIADIDEIQQNHAKGNLTDEEERSDFYTYYYKALSYLALKNIGKAIPQLKTAFDKSPDDSYKGKVQWYLALAYLKQGDIKTTKEWLRKLSQNNQAGKYKAMSEKLSQQLLHK